MTDWLQLIYYTVALTNYLIQKFLFDIILFKSVLYITENGELEQHINLSVLLLIHITN